jgi:hypothetical protein
MRCFAVPVLFLLTLMLTTFVDAASKRIAVTRGTVVGMQLPVSRFRAVTVLHKPCSTLGYTLTNFASNLGPAWPLLVLHNDDLSSSLQRNKIVRLQKAHGILRTASLERNGFPALSCSNSSSYSRLLASTRFWTSLRAKHILVFQTDSVLCSMSPWTINDFLQYDYIGAPWIDRWYGMDIGNGGLSLRKTKTMIRITKAFRFNETENEDIYFARGLYGLAERDRSVEIPPVHVAAKFAYEAGKLPRVTSFGVHKTPLREVDRDAIAETCPEAMAGVWRGCQVEMYEEVMTTPTKTRAKAAAAIPERNAVTKATLAGSISSQFARADERFLAADLMATDMLEFETDYVV